MTTQRDGFRQCRMGERQVTDSELLTGQRGRQLQIIAVVIELLAIFSQREIQRARIGLPGRDNQFAQINVGARQHCLPFGQRFGRSRTVSGR